MLSVEEWRRAVRCAKHNVVFWKGEDTGPVKKATKTLLYIIQQTSKEDTQTY